MHGYMAQIPVRCSCAHKVQCLGRLLTQGKGPAHSCSGLTGRLPFAHSAHRSYLVDTSNKVLLRTGVVLGSKPTPH